MASIKAGYMEGSQKAISEGTLHPDIAVDKPTMESIRFVHGSPFSPLLTNMHAYADRKTGVVQLREGTSDFVLYHETTHLLSGGMLFEFDEGITDLVAAEVYNRSHPEHDQVDPRGLVYGDQIATLDAVNRMTGGTLGLRELSQDYAGPDLYENTHSFVVRADGAIGLPVMVSMMRFSREAIGKNMGAHGGSVARLVSQRLMRRQAEFFAAMMSGGNGKKLAIKGEELMVRMLSGDAIKEYGRETVLDGLGVVAEALEIQSQRDA